MSIEHYEFGKMVIDGVEYSKDLIILNDKVIPNWRRKEGHFLCKDDLSAIEIKPDLLIVGTGSPGMMEVDMEVVDEFTTMVCSTRVAVKCYNDLKEKLDSVVAVFHLTC